MNERTNVRAKYIMIVQLMYNLSNLSGNKETEKNELWVHEAVTRWLRWVVSASNSPTLWINYFLHVVIVIIVIHLNLASFQA